MLRLRNVTQILFGMEKNICANGLNSVNMFYFEHDVSSLSLEPSVVQGSIQSFYKASPCLPPSWTVVS